MVGLGEEPTDPMLEVVARVVQENDCQRRQLVLASLLQDVELVLSREDMSVEDKEKARTELLGEAVLRSSMKDRCGFTIAIEGTVVPAGMCLLPAEDCPLQQYAR